MKKISKSALISIVFGSLILSSIIFNNEKTVEQKMFSDLTGDIKNRSINKIEFFDEHVYVYDKKNRLYKVILDSNSKALIANNIPEEVQVEYFNTPFWVMFCKHNLIGFLIVLLLFFSMMFGGLPGIRSRNKFKLSLDQKTFFSDIAGNEEAIDELKEVVEFLKNPQKFTKIGAKIPKGILLCGAPGTGKTLLAKAVSCEAKCSFYYASGSEFEEVYVGVGASRMRSLFEEAKKNSPSIIFIDEIDTIGVKRNKIGSVGDQTLNELLAQLDGFETNKSVILFAATNRPEALDAALLRPGRIGDRIIKVDLPYLKQREDILRVHLKNVKIDSSLLDVDSYKKTSVEETNSDNNASNIINLENDDTTQNKITPNTQKLENISTIAKITSGFSGADLANVVNEAALLAGKNNESFITLSHLKKSVEKVSMGSEKKNINISEEDKKRTAFHESGHAIIAKIFDENKSIHIITILPRGFALGYVYRTNTEEKDKVSETKNEMLNNIKICFGGYVAEQLLNGKNQVTSGPSNDLEQANKIAKNMIYKFGMGESFLTYNLEKEQVAPTSLSRIDTEVDNILKSSYNEVYKILDEKKDILNKLATLLLEKEVLYANEIEDFFQENRL
ncbi:ATP-dependent metallopeptidase FtsH/Yme1/Tma family protein [Alphaproteobacteria bacterium endosymbiont of Tiliacea citrago]|uniref:ATP-dependent metallopeptidase FtsH/Yme1/Tma family protein n=1 Tax=Alphaproteobacteria bacterium endosymbiont of Tiliacea citrago TaxID=3077944 RepID=UPI00313D48AD